MSLDTMKQKNIATAIVTGGSRGIGKAIAKSFFENGISVAVLSRHHFETTVISSEALSPRIAHYCCDISDAENCRSTVGQVVKDFGKIDILVNNAGCKIYGDLLDMDESLEDFIHCVDTDLIGTVRMTYFAAKHMRGSGNGGRIINISSNAGEMANKSANFISYCTAKAGVNQFTRAAALELAKYGIRINAIAPGYVYDKSMDVDKKLLEDSEKTVPTGRFALPEEIASLALYLTSPAAEQINGAIFTIDGGFSVGS